MSIFNKHDLVIVQTGFNIPIQTQRVDGQYYVDRHTVGLVKKPGDNFTIVALAGIGTYPCPSKNILPIGKGNSKAFYAGGLIPCPDCGMMTAKIFFDYYNDTCFECAIIELDRKAVDRILSGENSG